MTVTELIEKLEQIEDKSLPVVVRLAEEEAENYCNGAVVCHESKRPYCKGDGVFDKVFCEAYGIKTPKKVVYITDCVSDLR